MSFLDKSGLEKLWANIVNKIYENKIPIDTTLTQENHAADAAEVGKKFDLRTYVTPQEFGAVGDGETDDSDAIQTVLNSNKNIYCPPGTYLLSKPIEIWSWQEKNFICDGILKVNGDFAAIKINQANFRNIKIKTITTTTPGTGKGIEMHPIGSVNSMAAAYSNNIEIDSIYDLQYGVWINPEYSGVSYNKFTFNEINRVNIGIYFNPIAGSYINQNYFYGGSLANVQYPIKTDNSNNGAIDPFNGNVFESIGVEGSSQGLVLDFFQFNHFNNLRLVKQENTFEKCIKLSEDSYGNIFNSVSNLYAEQIEDNSNAAQGNIYDCFIQTATNPETWDLILGKKAFGFQGKIIIKEPDKYSAFTDITETTDLSSQIYAIEGHSYRIINDSNGVLEFTIPSAYNWDKALYLYIDYSATNNGTLLINRVVNGEKVVIWEGAPTGKSRIEVFSDSGFRLTKIDNYFALTANEINEVCGNEL